MQPCDCLSADWLRTRPVSMVTPATPSPVGLGAPDLLDESEAPSAPRSTRDAETEEGVRGPRGVVAVESTGV